MWGWVKKTAKKAWNGLKGAGSTILQLGRWALGRVFGIVELIFSIFGLRQKLRLRVTILLDEKGVPVADRREVEGAVDTARDVFREQMNVRLIGANGPIVRSWPERSPSYVLNVPCGRGAFALNFGEAGAWFRKRLARNPGGWIGYGAPVTIFIVRDVIDDTGCALGGPLADYGYVDAQSLSGSPGLRLTVAHEVGHTCDLIHGWGGGTLMHDQPEGRTSRLAGWQKEIFKSSPHVTLL